MMTDPVSDMLSRIRNAALAHLDRTGEDIRALRVLVAQYLHRDVTAEVLVAAPVDGADAAAADLAQHLVAAGGVAA